jgi:hypothetical protein
MPFGIDREAGARDNRNERAILVSDAMAWGSI